MEYSTTYRRGPSRSYLSRFAEYDTVPSAETGEPLPSGPAYFRPLHREDITIKRQTDADNLDTRADAGGRHQAEARRRERDRARSRREEPIGDRLPGYIPTVPHSPAILPGYIPTSRNADILTLSQESRDAISDVGIRDHLVLCVYRNSRKSFATYKLSLLSKSGHPTGYITNRPFFRRVYRDYDFHLRGWFRRLFSFKTITTVRLVQFGAGEFFTSPQDETLFPSAFMKALKDPDMYCNQGSRDWVDWIDKAKQNPKLRGLDIAIELKENYDAERLVLAAGFALLIILVLTAVWLVKGGDASYVSGVMSYVLTFVGAVFGLTALWDWFDAGRSETIHELAAPTLPEDFEGVPRGAPFYPRAGL